MHKSSLLFLIALVKKLSSSFIVSIFFAAFASVVAGALALLEHILINSVKFEFFFDDFFVTISLCVNIAEFSIEAFLAALGITYLLSYSISSRIGSISLLSIK